MTGQTSSNRPRVSIRWALVLCYSTVILFTLGLVRTLRDMLTEILGPQGFSLAVTGIFLLFGAGAVVWVLLRRIYRSPARLLMIIVSAVLYVVFLSQLELAVERIHYLQYGIAAILALRALIPTFPNAGVFLLALGYVYALGILDESLQWVLPMRVGEIRDVWINLTAGALGLLLAATVGSHDLLKRLPDRKTIKVLFLGTAALIIVTSAFLHFVHGFGHVHRLPSGTKFTSVFTREQLEGVSQTPDIELWEDFSSSPLSVREGSNLFESCREQFALWKALKHPTPDAFNYEAWRHRRHRDGLENPRYAMVREALEEELILSSFYRSYWLRFDLSWSPEKRKRCKQESFKRIPYESPIQELLITAVRPRGLWILSASVALLFVFSGMLFSVRQPRVVNHRSDDGIEHEIAALDR